MQLTSRLYILIAILIVLTTYAFCDDGNFHGAIQGTDVTSSGGYFNGDGSKIINLSFPMTINNGVSHSTVSSTSSTGFQISTTKKAMVIYSVKISTSSTIAGSSEGKVYLETAATNSTTPSDWTSISKISNGQSLSLALALRIVQPITEPLMGMIPVGNYVRIRSNNISGTPTYTYITGQEILL